MLAKVFLAGIATVLTAGAAYPRWTRMRAAQWERRETWSAEGIRKNALPYEIGSGQQALVCVHGFASSPAVFRLMAPALAHLGFGVHAVRLPGFGERIEAMFKADEQAWRSAVRTAVLHARSRHSKVWLMGHSMGGTLAIDFAQTNSGIVDGLILLAPLLQVSARRSLGLPPERLFRIAESILPPTLILGTAFPVDLNARREGIDEDRDRFLPMSLYSAMFRLVASVRSRPAVLNAPALFVVPGSDKVVSRRACRAYYLSVRAPKKALVEAPRAGHVVPLDYGWQGIVQAIRAFVEESEPRRGQEAAP